MKKLSRAALAMFLAMSLSGIANAANPSATGLGEAWPNATDVSTNPNWHVYAFVLNGIKYVQVNDLNGDVLGAIGTSGNQFITLPIGRFAQYVSTPQQATATTSNAKPTTAPTTVYKDNSTAITATLQSDGAVQLSVRLIADGCGDDPADCSAVTKAL